MRQFTRSVFPGPNRVYLNVYIFLIRRKIITTCLQHVTTLKKPNGKSVFPSKCYTLIHVNSAICCPQKSNWLYFIILIKKGWQSCWDLATTGPNYFVFRRLYPSFPSHYGSILVLPVISLLFNSIAGAGKFYYMMGEVSWDPKRRRSWPSYYSILSAWQPFKII